MPGPMKRVQWRQDKRRRIGQFGHAPGRAGTSLAVRVSRLAQQTYRPPDVSCCPLRISDNGQAASDRPPRAVAVARKASSQRRSRYSAAALHGWPWRRCRLPSRAAFAPLSRWPRQCAPKGLHSPTAAPDDRRESARRKTSSAATETWPLCKALTSAAGSTRSPRATLTKITPGFMRAMDRALIKPRVAAVDGQCNVTTSACTSKSSSDVATQPARSMSAAGTTGS